MIILYESGLYSSFLDSFSFRKVKRKENCQKLDDLKKK